MLLCLSVEVISQHQIDVHIQLHQLDKCVQCSTCGAHREEDLVTMQHLIKLFVKFAVLSLALWSQHERLWLHEEGMSSVSESYKQANCVVFHHIH